MRSSLRPMDSRHGLPPRQAVGTRCRDGPTPPTLVITAPPALGSWPDQIAYGWGALIKAPRRPARMPHSQAARAAAPVLAACDKLSSSTTTVVASANMVAVCPLGTAEIAQVGPVHQGLDQAIAHSRGSRDRCRGQQGAVESAWRQSGGDDRHADAPGGDQRTRGGKPRRQARVAA